VTLHQPAADVAYKEEEGIPQRLRMWNSLVKVPVKLSFDTLFLRNPALNKEDPDGSIVLQTITM
jgi:hypothetical protein